MSLDQDSALSRLLSGGLSKINDSAMRLSSRIANNEVENVPLAAGLMGGVGVGMTVGGSKLFRRKIGTRNVLLGALAGVMSPIIHNRVVRLNDIAAARNEDVSMDKLRSVFDTSRHVKTAGLGSGADRIAAKAANAVFKTAKAAASGLLPTKANAKLGEKVVGYAAKGAAIGTAGYFGAKKIFKGGQKSKNDYTTYLRNGLVAGTIKPNEISPLDLAKVKEMGMD